jgi:excinuclease ABC subunit C
MVVFLDGEPAKSEYRTFKVKSATNDDFASMYEVLSRRFRRSKGVEAKAGEPKKGWVTPDLLVIDGGKGQLGTAIAALRDAQIDIGMNGMDVCALAKERLGPRPKDGAGAKGDYSDEKGEKQPDRVFRMNAKDPMKLRPNSAEMLMLARIRDEAHRFAVTFHKKLRRRRTLRSALEDVPGVGQKRKRELLKHFGSLKKVRAAGVEELVQAPGMSRTAAEAVVRYFQGESPPPTVDSPPPEAADQTDVAEDAAADELEEIATEEEAAGDEEE